MMRTVTDSCEESVGKLELEPWGRKCFRTYYCLSFPPSLSLSLFLSLLPSFLPSLFISSVFLPHSSSLHVSPPPPLPPQASLFPSSQLLGSSVPLSSISLPLPLSATRTTKMMHRHTSAGSIYMWQGVVPSTLPHWLQWRHCILAEVAPHWWWKTWEYSPAL